MLWRSCSIWPLAVERCFIYGETLITNLSWESRWEKESQKNTIVYLKSIRQGTELLGCIFSHYKHQLKYQHNLQGVSPKELIICWAKHFDPHSTLCSMWPNAFNETAVMLGKHSNYYHNNDGKNQTFICIFHEASVSNIRFLFSSGSRWVESAVRATSQVMERWPAFPITNISWNINTTFKECHQKNWLFAGLNISTHTQHCAVCATNAFNETAVMLGKHSNYYHNNDGKNQTFIQWQTSQLGFVNYSDT